MTRNIRVLGLISTLILVASSCQHLSMPLAAGTRLGPYEVGS